MVKNKSSALILNGFYLFLSIIYVLNKEITTPGVQLPLSKEVYEPILKELKEFGIDFTETKVPYLGYNPMNVVG